jgi:hypothetical protein
VGGGVLLVSMFLMPWYQLQTSTPTFPKFFVASSVDGWHGLSHARWLILLTILAALGLLFFQATRRAPAIPATFSLVAGLLGALSALWLIYRVVINPPGGREIGGWIGLLSAGAITYGGYASFRLEGIAASDAPAEIPTIGLEHQGRT